MKLLPASLFILLLVIVAACAPSTASTPALTPITVQLGTTHQAIYAGFYAADQNGNYAREGLAVTFTEGALTLDVVQPVTDDTAQFGIIGASTLITARANGQPVRALATILRRDPVVFFSLADSGIVRLEDFMGKKVFVSVRLRPRLYSMLNRIGITPDAITEVNTGDYTALYTGDIDIASGLITTSVLSARQAGYEVNIIYPDDYGVHFYSITIFASDDYIAANPELVTRFVRATLQGWTYAVENPQTVGEMVVKYNPDADSARETASMIASLPYINTGEDHIGWMKPEIWEGMAQTMREQDELTTPLDITDVYTLQFIQQIYGGNSSVRQFLYLTPKVTLVFVLFATALLASVGVLAYTSGRATLETATFSGLLSTAIEKQAAFETRITQGQQQIASIVESPYLRDSVAILRNTADSATAQAAHDRIVSELLPLIGQRGVFEDLMVLEPDLGKIIAATDASEEGKFKEDRPYFINGRNEPYVQNIYFSLECQCPAMTAAAPIKSDDGELLAVLAGRLNLAEIGIIISRSTGLRQSEDAFLVNTSSLFVTQPRFVSDPVILQRGIHTTASEQCLAGSSGSILAEDYRGVPAAVVYRWLPERQLCLIVKVDQAEAFEPVLAFGRTLLFISGLALLVASILAVALARTITRPILALNAGVVRFGKGELEIRLPENSEDELGMLAHEFNVMADAIAEKETLLQNHADELEQRVAERTAQLSFLANASRLLTESVDYSTRLKQVAQLAVPQIADWCSVDILDDDGILRRLAVVHTDPQKVEFAYELQRRHPPEPDGTSGTYNVLRTGKSELIPVITDEMLAATIKDAEILSIVRELGLQSAMIVPLLAHDRALGTLTLVMAESGRHYKDSDLTLAEDLARRAALLIDNARLYQRAQQMNAELERRVTERTIQLTATNRELEAFSYSVSHDLRAPLRALDGFGQALEEDYADYLDDTGKNYLGRIRAGSQRMGQLIDDLLALSRLTRTEFQREQLDLSLLARRIAEELREQYPEHPVEFRVEDGLIVAGDARLLGVALSNLLGNAWKYTGKQSHPRVEFGVTEHQNRYAYFVRDNGAGFDMAYANKLFGVFQRLHSANEFPGNGVGLAIVQRIILRHGGQIWAEAAVGQGATFYFSL